MIAGLPGFGLSSLFYAVLLLGMGLVKLYQGSWRLVRRILPRGTTRSLAHAPAHAGPERTPSTGITRTVR